jgi:hypothetical protein
MRVAALIFSTLFCAATTFASEIREFDIPTLEKLGRELSHRDEIAAQASDLVLTETLRIYGCFTAGLDH